VRTTPTPPRLAIQALARIAMVSVVVACSLGIQQPAKNSTVIIPTTATSTHVVVTANAGLILKKLLVDGIDSAGKMNSIGSDRYEGDLVLSAGQHTIEADGDVWCWYCGGYTQSSDASTFTIQGPPLPRLSFSPAGSITIDVANSSSVSVAATQAPTTATQVTLAVSSNNVSAPASATIGANQTSSPPFSVTGQIPGSATITASSAGFQSGTLTVTVRPPAVTLTLAPNPLVVERGSSGSTTATIGRSGGFAGAVAITPSTLPLPTGVSVSPLTIPPGVTTGQLTFAVGSLAVLQTANLTIKAANTPSGTPNSTAPLTLVIPTATGPFVEASPAPYINGAMNTTVSSLAGAFSVDINTGASAGVPQPRAAQFRKGGAFIGSAVGFSIGPSSNLGGAGFCVDNGAKPTRTRGVVMTSTPVGSNAQYGFTFIDLMGNPNVIRQMVADASKPTPYLFAQPRIYFSPDCTLALVIGVNIPGPSNYLLTVNNMETGNPLPGPCGSPIQFNTYTSPTAVVQRAGSQTSVVVTVDGGAQTSQTCTYAVP
jgi:hypothetical protein